MERENTIRICEQKNNNSNHQELVNRFNLFIHSKIKTDIGVRNYLLSFKNVLFLANNKYLIVLCKTSKEANIVNEKYSFQINKIINNIWKNKQISVKFCFVNPNIVLSNYGYKNELNDNYDFQNYLAFFSSNLTSLFNNNDIMQIMDDTSVFIEKPKNEVLYFNEHLHEKTFKNFVCNDDNMTAFEVCQSIACANDKELIQAGSVVLLYGESSVGKTHLLQAINNYYQSAGGKVVYFKASNFLRSYVEAVQRQTSFLFQDNILSNEIIIIDDIDDLIGKNGTLQALKQIIALAIETKRFVVLSSKATPNSLIENNGIFKTILSNAMPLKIDNHKNDLKMHIAMNYIAEKNMNVPISIVKDLILHLDCNTRELKNYIKKLAIVQSIRKFELNSTLALEILKDDVGNDIKNKKNISNEQIVKIVAEYYSTTMEALQSKIKTAEICRARNVAILFMRNINNANLPEIGRVLNRTHATIIASLKNMEKWLDSDKKLPSELADIRAMMK